MDDFRDQVEGVFRAQPEADKGDVRLLPRRGSCNLAHVDFSRDHLVSEFGYDLRKKLEPVAALVCDQDAEMPRVVRVCHRRSAFADTEPAMLLATEPSGFGDQGRAAALSRPKMCFLLRTTHPRLAV